MTAQAVPSTIQAAKDILSGKLPMISELGYRPEPDEDIKDRLLEPSELVRYLSEAETRNCFDSKLPIELERVVNQSELRTPEEYSEVLALYERATKTALATLVRYSKGHHHDYDRLTARICLALHQELDQLVKDYEAVKREWDLAREEHRHEAKAEPILSFLN